MNQFANKGALDLIARPSQAGDPDLVPLDREDVAKLLKFDVKVRAESCWRPPGGPGIVRPCPYFASPAGGFCSPP
jgi:hypothetical protein